MTEFMLTEAWLTVKPVVLVTVPPGIIIETSLVLGVAELPIAILAVIWLGLSTVKLLTVIPEPKLTEVAPVK